MNLFNKSVNYIFIKRFYLIEQYSHIRSLSGFYCFALPGIFENLKEIYRFFFTLNSFLLTSLLEKATVITPSGLYTIVIESNMFPAVFLPPVLQ